MLMKARPAPANRVHAACAVPGGRIRIRTAAGIRVGELPPTGMLASQIQIAYQTSDALLECLAARDLDPINCSGRERGVDEII